MTLMIGAAACVGKGGRDRLAEGWEERVGELESWKYKTGGSKGKRESLEGLICCEWEDGPKTEKPSEGPQANEG